MSKKEGKGLKSFNKGFQVPDTYIIIFLVVVVAALLTFLVPKGFYETQDISYMINGVEKTRTVIKDGSFQYLTDDAGNVVTEGVALFSGDGGTGFFNYMYRNRKQFCNRDYRISYGSRRCIRYHDPYRSD